jgi:hypothetical protein
MCTLVILRRPGHDWPVVIGANRDEMAGRPWQGPARHWPDRPEVTAGRDELAGGTWLGLNDDGVVAGVLNRRQSLGPAPDARSRGELPLEALDHAEAEAAAAALADIDPRSYRSFNMIIADSRKTFWLCSRIGEPGTDHDQKIAVSELPPGLSMITAHDLNSPDSRRIALYRPRFEAARPPDPGSDEWSDWRSLLASRVHDAEAGPGGAMAVVTDRGFGTLSSTLIALPKAPGGTVKPRWLFAAGCPGKAPFEPVSL